MQVHQDSGDTPGELLLQGACRFRGGRRGRLSQGPSIFLADGMCVGQARSGQGKLQRASAGSAQEGDEEKMDLGRDMAGGNDRVFSPS